MTRNYDSYGGFQAPPLTYINKRLLIIAGVFFLLQSIFEKIVHLPLGPFLGLSLKMVMQGHLYQLLTYPFIQIDLFSFVFKALIIWMVGGELELQWGSFKYLKFLVISLLGAAFVYLGVSALFINHSAIPHLQLRSLQGISYALLLAYGILYQNRLLTFMLIFPMKAKYFCMILVGIELYMGIFSSHYGVTAWGHLGAFLFAYLFLRFPQFHQIRIRLSSKESRPKKRSSEKSHLYIIKPENNGNGNDKEDTRPDHDSKKGPKYWH